MTKEQPASSRPKRVPTHPGEILREDVLPRLNLTSKGQLGSDLWKYLR
jgi:hypothetical protein